MRVTSKNNQQIKQMRRLHQSAYRRQTGFCLVEGICPIQQVLDTGGCIETLIYTPDYLVSPLALAMIERLQQGSTHLIETTAEVFDSLAIKPGAQGIAAVVRQNWRRLDDIIPAQNDLFVALTGVQYPGNLGTIVRTCDAVGAAGIILLGNTTDPYHPKALRASMGAVFNQTVIRANLDTFAQWCADQGCTVVGAAPDATVPYSAYGYALPLVLMLGSEGEGMAEQERALCDDLVAIPMAGISDSLNLAVAAGVLLYAIQNCALG